MGSWAYGPLDNDVALDWVDGILGKVVDDTNQVLQQWQDDVNNFEGELLRAAAEVCKQMAPLSPEIVALLPQLHQALETLSTSEWVDRWDDPPKVAAAIRSQMARLQTAIQASRLKEDPL